MEAISLREIYFANLHSRKYEPFFIFLDDEIYENGWLVYEPEETDIKQCRIEVIVDGIVVKHFNPFIDREIICSFGPDDTKQNIYVYMVQMLAKLFHLHTLSQEVIDWWQAKENNALWVTMKADFENNMIKRMTAEITAEIDKEIIESIMKVAGALPK